MSEAFKCDRCGKLYEASIKPDIRVERYNNPFGITVYDLCPECIEELEKWLKEKKDV